LIHEIGEIVGVTLDRHRTLGFVRAAMSPAIRDQHARIHCQPLGDRAPERSIHGERVDEDNTLAGCGMIVERVSEMRAVAHARPLFGAWHRVPSGRSVTRSWPDRVVKHNNFFPELVSKTLAP